MRLKPTKTKFCDAFLAEGRESRDEQTVKSEISEESGYFSLKQDEDVVNLSVHDHHKQQQLQHRRYAEEGEFRRGRDEQRTGDRRRRGETRSGGSRERWDEPEGRRDRSSDSQSMVRNQYTVTVVDMHIYSNFVFHFSFHFAINFALHFGLLFAPRCAPPFG